MEGFSIIGAGGHGRVVAEIAELVGFTDLYFVDKDFARLAKNEKWQVRSENEINAQLFFCAIGDNYVRESIVSKFNVKFSPQLIHPKAIISASATLGNGSCMMAGSIINANTHAGIGCIFNTNSSVDHDCFVGDFVHISPGATVAGNVNIGDRTWIGMGSSIKEGVNVGANVVVGAGSTVISDIKDNDKVMGSPARIYLDEGRG